MLVVLDEPNANLDVAGERALADCLKQLKREGTTLFVISHRTPILKGVDKLLMLKEGQVAKFGPPDQVAQPAGQPIRGRAGQAAPAAAVPIRPSAQSRTFAQPSTQPGTQE